MKVTKSVKLDLKKITTSLFNRDKLAADIKKYWVGRTESNIGLQFVRFKDGRLVSDPVDTFARKDLVCYQYPDSFNIFVEPDGRMTWNLFNWDDKERIELEPGEKESVETYLRGQLELDETKEHFKRNKKFLDAAPWVQINGMTPEEAVAKLTELGWNNTEKE